MGKNVEFLVFSDCHFHEWLPYSHNNSSLIDVFGNDIMPYMQGMNSRLIDCAKMLKQIADYAEEHDITNVFFTGDMAHSKNVSKTVSNVISLCFQHLNDSHPEIHFSMIAGNHDYSDRIGTNHSLIPIMHYSNVTVADSINGDDFFLTDKYGRSLAVRAVPFIEDKELLKRAINAQVAHADYHVLLFHTGFQGAKLGSDYIMLKDHDLSADDIHSKKFDVCLSGHFHEPQKLFANGWMVGATHQHVWSDAGGKRGFIHVTIDEEHVTTVKHIETREDIPRFHIVSHGDDLSHIRPQDFVKYKVNEKLSEDLLQRVQGHVLACVGSLPASLELVLMPAEKGEEFTLSEKAVSADTVLLDWIEQAKTDLDKEALQKMGQELLNDARQV